MFSWSITRTRGEEVVSRSLVGWGISNPKITPRSLGVSELTFSIVRQDVFADSDFDFGDLISLRCDGVQRFYGRVKKLPASGNGGKKASESDLYVVADPWDDLERLNYLQPRQIANVTGESVVDYSAVDTSQVTLGAQASTGDIVPTGDQIAAIIAFAVHFGCILQAGTIPMFRTIPIDVGRDITCAESIKRCLSYDPSVVSWFDYSTTPPTLNFQKRAALDVVEIDMAAGGLVEAFSIAKRADLVPRGIIFNYLTTQEATETVGGEDVVRTVDKITPDSAGPVFEHEEGEEPEGFGLDVPVATIELTRTAAGVYEDIPSGLASYYYEQLAMTPYEGSLRLKGREVPTVLGLGNVFNLTNGKAEWATMKALVQNLTIDIAKGSVEIQFGASPFLTPKDFVDLLMFNRRQQMPSPKSNFPGVQPPPVPGNPNPIPGGPANPGGGNMQQKQIKVCEGGTTSTVTVYGP